MASKSDETVSYIKNEEFTAAKNKVVGVIREKSGIGTLGEKTVHAILKNMYEPDDNYQEVAIEGYVADICNNDGIIEIQTANFNKLRQKLAVFLNLYPVTVVYPIPYTKWLSWIDPQTGETGKRRKAPKKWNAYYAFYELYKIKDFLKNPNLKLRIVLMDIEEYRLLNGWNETRKRGSTRYDRIPLGIREETVIEQPEDYLQFMPYELDSLEGGFDSAAFAKAAHIDVKTARQVLNILYYVGAVRRTGKKGNSYIYEGVSDW